MGNQQLAFFMSFLAAAAVALALILYSPQPDSVGTPRDVVVANRAKWQQLKPATYTAEITRVCFCERWTISADVGTGRDETITFIEPAPTSGHGDRREFPRNVDDIFAIIDREYAAKAYSINIVFDEAMGYPTQIDIDRIKEYIDDELKLFVTVIGPRHVG